MPDSGKKTKTPEPLFFTPYPKKKGYIQCTLCPHLCVTAPGSFGQCLVRGCDISGDRGTIPFAGKISAISVDPIEKKPLYHFFPGSDIFSVGFYGCNLKCPFCQNYQISTRTDAHAKTIEPEDAVSMALEYGSMGIAYTYSEPIVHIEWVAEASRLARGKGLKNVLVTNGCINPEPGEYLLRYTDAANVDLKSYNAGFYSHELKGNLNAVKDFIVMAAEMIHLEVTTLVIPGKNDSEKEISEIAEFIASVDRKIPLHLSCYYPVHKYTIPRTSEEKVFQLAKTASRSLDYVYPGNTGIRKIETRCSFCGETLVSRTGYRTDTGGLVGSKCRKCGAESGIITG